MRRLISTLLLSWLAASSSVLGCKSNFVDIPVIQVDGNVDKSEVDGGSEVDEGVGAPDAAASGDAAPVTDSMISSGDAAVSADAAIADASIDAAVPDASTNDPCADKDFCENFDNYQSLSDAQALWSTQLQGGAAALDTKAPFSGTQSARLSTSGAGHRQAYIVLDTSKYLRPGQSEQWGRAMMWLYEAPRVDSHWTHIEAEGPADELGQTAVARFGGQHSKSLMASYDVRRPDYPDCYSHSTTPMPEGRWTCYEWKFDWQNDEMRLWMDGQEVSGTAVQNKKPLPGPAHNGCVQDSTQGNWYIPRAEKLRLGWEHFQDSIDHQIWVDDIVIDDERIGCPMP